MADKETKTLTADRLEKMFEAFKKTRNTPNGYDLSWEHCIGEFARAFSNPQKATSDEKTVDYLSLHLGFYLASWGMLRGSSGLSKCDYKVHAPVVKTILGYSDLFGKDLQDFLNAQTRERFETLRKDVVEYCRQFCNAKDYKASDTLVSKIILGTFGITPAYDRYFKKSVIDYGITTGTYNIQSLEKLADYFSSHHAAEVAEMTKTMQKQFPLYTRARVIDALLYTIGIEDEYEKKENKSR